MGTILSAVAAYPPSAGRVAPHYTAGFSAGSIESDISNMGPLNKYDAFLILVTAPVPAICLSPRSALRPLTTSLALW